MSIASIIFLAAQLSSSGQHLPQSAILPTRAMVRRQEQTSGQGGGEPPEIFPMRFFS